MDKWEKLKKKLEDRLEFYTAVSTSAVASYGTINEHSRSTRDTLAAVIQTMQKLEKEENETKNQSCR